MSDRTTDRVSDADLAAMIQSHEDCDGGSCEQALALKELQRLRSPGGASGDATAEAYRRWPDPHDAIQGATRYGFIEGRRRAPEPSEKVAEALALYEGARAGKLQMTRLCDELTYCLREIRPTLNTDNLKPFYMRLRDRIDAVLERAAGCGHNQEPTPWGRSPEPDGRLAKAAELLREVRAYDSHRDNTLACEYTAEGWIKERDEWLASFSTTKEGK